MSSRATEERGAVLVLVALLMTAFLALGALAIDIGSYYQAQRQAQSAADAGALAAAQDLPSSASAATSDGTTYATTNFKGSTVGVTTPYNSSSGQVKVSVTASTPVFLGKFLGLTKETVSASAVAGAGSSGGTSYAIFAQGTSCSGTGLQLQAGNLHITGGVHSNGSMLASGHGNTYSSGTYGGPNGCSWTDNSGGDNSFGGSTSPTVDATNEPWPDNYAPYFPVQSGSQSFTSSGDPNCTFVGTDLNLNQNDLNTTLATGTYCYNTIEFNTTGITCTCTFVAMSVQFNQGSDNFSPNFTDPSTGKKLMFMDLDTNNININSNGPNFLTGGTVFCPNTPNLTINAPSGNVSGFVEAPGVTVNGGGTTNWTGTSPTVGGTTSSPSLLQ